MTIVGARKYDYPPVFTRLSPWWEDYKVLNDYFARLSLVLSQGEQMNDILVLEPDHDDLALLLLCHERPPLHGDRQRIPAFRHHARKGAGGIRPGLGEHHQGSRLGQGR